MSGSFDRPHRLVQERHVDRRPDDQGASVVQGTTTAPPAGVAADAAIKGNIVQLEGGAYHTCLRLRRGAVYCWGQGAYGQLGTNTPFPRHPDPQPGRR